MSSLDKCHGPVTYFLSYEGFPNNSGIILLLLVSVRQKFDLIIAL